MEAKELIVMAKDKYQSLITSKPKTEMTTSTTQTDDSEITNIYGYNRDTNGGAKQNDTLKAVRVKTGEIPRKVKQSKSYVKLRWKPY